MATDAELPILVALLARHREEYTSDNTAALKLIHPSAWTENHERTYFTTPLQRKVLFSMCYYLPFLNMNVVYDNTRLLQELGANAPALPPLTSYLGSLLEQIDNAAFFPAESLLGSLAEFLVRYVRRLAQLPA